MTESTGSAPRFLKVLSAVLYGAAVLVLLGGLVILIAALSSASGLGNSLIGLQVLGGQALFNVVAPMLRAALINLGIVEFVIALVLSLVLFTAGKLSAFAFDQSLRLEAAERALAEVRRELADQG